VHENGQKNIARNKVQNQHTVSYAYTKMTSASPIHRNAVYGATNIPMSYSGPPTQAEMLRNHNRKDYTRSTIALNNHQFH
jgi:hypothetical protein